MATPSGHVYCKECIVEYLLAKTQELKRQREAFEAQAKNEETDEAMADERRKIEAAGAFVSSQTQLVIAKTQPQPQPRKERGSACAISSHHQQGNDNDEDADEDADNDNGNGNSSKKGKKRARGIDGKPTPEIVIQKDLTQRAILKTKKQRQEELRSSSWWLPQFQPAAPEEKIVEPPKRPASPMSGQPLRAKDMIPVNFTIDAEKQKTAHLSGGETNKGSIICPVTRKGITSQKMMLIKRTGHVMLEDAVKQFALPTMTCPVTGEKIKKKDLVPLINGGTSFTASGQVEVTKYAPGLR
ncbi:unnamed protein product [Ascophyllum nodosum]